MHEVSICQSIINTLESQMEESEWQYLKEVRVKIGVLSCVDPAVLAHVYKYVIAGGPFESSVLTTTMVDVVARCNECLRNFKVENYRFVCPHCGKPSSDIIEGNELRIYQIILQEPSYAEINQ